MIGFDFYDTNDNDRIVVPEKDLGTHYLCSIYWRDSGYGGKTTLSKKLFNVRYGFVSKDDLGK